MKFLESVKRLAKNFINFGLIYVYLKFIEYVRWLLPSKWQTINNYITIIIYIMIVIKLINLLGIKINIQFIKEVKEKEKTE